MPMPLGSERSSVACVIPTHGRPRLVVEALCGALAQTVGPREVFVVDDEGSEEARGVVDEIARSAAIRG
jgi:glycosyltransferase involved in cell wall biosynthesis